MITAQPKRGVQVLLSGMLQLLATFFFSSIHWPTQQPHPQRPVLFIGNHQSWWDGILVFILHQKIWKRPFFAMMLFPELEKRRFLRFIGAFSIRKNHKSILESLHYSLELLEKPNSVLVFPQGRLESQFVSPLHLEKGILYLIKHLPTQAEIWALSIHYSMTDSIRAQCHIYVQPLAARTPQEVEAEWNAFHQSCIELQKQQWI